MMTNSNDVRLPAEWEPQGAVLVAWPHEATDWNYMLGEAQDCYINIIKTVSKYSKVIVIAPDTSEVRQRLSDLSPEKIVFFDVPTNDTWTRDYGVITTVGNDGVHILNDFAFNGWGGKFESSLDNGVTARMYEAGLIRGRYADNLDFILEGGSIESDGRGTIMVTSSCLLNPNRNKGFSKKDIEERLAKTFGAKKVLWLDKGEILGDDTDGHIDTIARLAPHNTILFCGKSWCNGNDEQARALDGVAEALSEFTAAEGTPFNLIELPMPEPVRDPDDGHVLPATYANFLIINDAVILPSYGQPAADRHARLAIEVAFPDHKIETVDCRALIRQHGSLHCATMQLPDAIIPF